MIENSPNLTAQEPQKVDNARWCLLNSSPRPRTDEELHELYGPHAAIDHLERFNLIHLDNPNPEERAKRLAEFNPDDLFEDDCPLCQMLKNEHCDVIYDGREDKDGGVHHRGVKPLAEHLPGPVMAWEW